MPRYRAEVEGGGLSVQSLGLANPQDLDFRV